MVVYYEDVILASRTWMFYWIFNDFDFNVYPVKLFFDNFPNIQFIPVLLTKMFSISASSSIITSALMMLSSLSLMLQS